MSASQALLTPGFAAMKLAVEASPASTYPDSEVGGVSLELSHLTDDGEGVLLIPHGRRVNSTKASSSNSNKSSSQAVAKTGSDTGKAEARVERYTPPFVRNGQRSADDPFHSPKAKSASSNKDSGKKTVNALSRDNWRSSSGSSHGSNSSVGSSSKGKGKQPTQPTGTMRIGHFIGGTHGREFSAVAQVPVEDTTAQETSSSSVFVANLLKTATDDRLAEDIVRVFGEYGAVDVKVRRDSREMPFAFVQYTREQDATRAIQFGHSRLILGRACRCERAKANRTYLVESRDGVTVVPEIVRSIMSDYGLLDSVKATTPAICQEHGIDEGVIVRFRTYDAGQAACNGMRQHEKLKMKAAPTLQLPAASVPPGPVTQHTPSTEEVDRHSIFVGNVFATTTDTHITKLFREFGRIENIERHECESKYIPGTQYYFAFVEYKYESSCVPAIQKMHFYEYYGQTLKVQQKMSRPQDPVRGQQNIRTPPHILATYRAPAPRMQQVQQIQNVQQVTQQYPPQHPQQFQQHPQQFQQHPQQFQQHPQQFQQQIPQHNGLTYYTPPHLGNGIQVPYGWTWSAEYNCWAPSPPPTYYNTYAGFIAAQEIGQISPVFYGPHPAALYQPTPPYMHHPQFQNVYTPPAGSQATSDERVTTPTPLGAGQTGDSLGSATL